MNAAVSPMMPHLMLVAQDQERDGPGFRPPRRASVSGRGATAVFGELSSCALQSTPLPFNEVKLSQECLSSKFCQCGQHDLYMNNSSLSGHFGV
jgi:hypothetical protein